MKLYEKILANVIVAILLTSCYILLPIVLITAFMLDMISVTYTYTIALFRSAWSTTSARCSYWVIVPLVLLAWSVVQLIKSRRIHIANASLLFWSRAVAKLDTTRKAITNFAVPSIGAGKVWEFVKDHHMSFARAESHGTNDAIMEETIEKQDADRAVARVRTKEEDRLHQYIQALQAIDAESLPENMTTEQAILLTLTRMAAADRKGLVYYRLSEEHLPSRPDQTLEKREHSIMHPHARYCKLSKSEQNLFRLDEPDCLICLEPLAVGEEMITHETCRRTFHTVCFNRSLLGERTCPYDREDLVVRADVVLDELPIPEEHPIAQDDQQGVADLFAAMPLHAAPEQLEDHHLIALENRRDELRAIWIAILENDEHDDARPADQQHQGLENDVPQNQEARQNTRPANNGPHQNHRPLRQWQPTRPWR